MKTVSIAIVNWNTRELLRACLQSVPPQEGDLRTEVIVVDNGSSDDSADMVATDFPAARLVRNSDNRGFVQANNQGLRAATGDYLFMLNSDAQLTPGCLTRLVQVVDAEASIGVAAPRLTYPDGAPQSAALPFPRLWDWALPAVVLHRRNRAYDAALRPEGLQDVDWVTGAAMLFRRDVLERVGPLDERYFMWLDDMDWCRKLQHAGLRRVYVPDAVVLHHKAQSTVALSEGAFREQVFESEYLYLRLHHGLPATWLVYLMRSARATAQLLLARAPEQRQQARLKLGYHRRRFGRWCFGRLPAAPGGGA